MGVMLIFWIVLGIALYAFLREGDASPRTRLVVMGAYVALVYLLSYIPFPSVVLWYP